MKDKNNNYVTITACDNSVLRLPEIPGLFTLSKYNMQYQENQKKKSFWKKLIKRRK